MTDQIAASMRRRVPGQAEIEKTLAEHTKARGRGPLARLFGVRALNDQTRTRFTDAQGEVAVGRVLSALPDGWVSYHSLPIGNRETNIDHVVVGPGGVFTVTTRNHRGKTVWVSDRMVRVADAKKPGFIPAAEREAHRLTHLLRTRVPEAPDARALLVFVAPSKLTARPQPEHVVVLDAVDVSSWLLAQDTVLSGDESNRLTTLMDDPSFWPPRRESAEPDAAARFATLERAVRSARAIRTGWTLGGVAAVVAAGAAFAPSILISLFP